MDNGILGYFPDTICPLLPHKHALNQSLGKYIALVRVLWTVHSLTDLYEPGRIAVPVLNHICNHHAESAKGASSSN